MIIMLDNFNNYEINRFKYYDGTNGNKICLLDENGTKYMLKTPPLKNKNTKDEYYTN